MSIGCQTLRVGSFVQNLTARQRKKSQVRKVVMAALMLTSMVDMFSLLVIFLLQSFSNSPEIMTMQKGLVLPAAISAQSAQDAAVFAITEEAVLLDQVAYGKASAVLAKPEEIAKKLEELRKNWEKAHPAEVFKGDIHLQADRQLSSHVVSQFVQLLVGQGFHSVHLAVVSQGR